jgi:PBSX family phage terminase large subunit
MIKGTIVFKKNWEAINLKCYLVKQKQDNIFEFYILNKATGDYKYLFDKEVDLSKYRLDEYSSISYLCDIKNLKEFGEENLMNRYKYILNSGSSRSSKTVSLIDVYDLYARTHENKRMTVWRDTKKDCKDTVLKDAIKHFRKTGRYGVNQVFNKTESYFMYNTHSTFEINGTDDEEKVHGLTQDCAWLNEPYKIGRDTFDQIDQRTSDFVFVDLNPKKDHWSDDLQKNPRCLRIHSTFKDNPFCPPEQRAKILGYQPVKRTFAVESGLITEHEAMTYDFKENSKNIPEKNLKELLRCVLNVEQRTANIVKWDIYGRGLKAEKPDRIFNWEEIMYHDYLNLNTNSFLYGVDWGKVDKFGIVEVKYYDNCLYVHELNYDSEDEWEKKLSVTERNAIKKENEGFITWLFTKLNVDKKKDIICDSNRPLKIAALRANKWERAVAIRKQHGSIVDGVDLLQNLRVFYTHTSENIKYEQENYSRSKDSNGKVLDEPIDADNHLIDPIRYVALYLQQIGVIKII